MSNLDESDSDNGHLCQASSSTCQRVKVAAMDSLRLTQRRQKSPERKPELALDLRQALTAVAAARLQLPGAGLRAGSWYMGESVAQRRKGIRLAARYLQRQKE